VFSFRRQPFIRLKLEQPPQIVSLSADKITAGTIYVRSAAQAELNCAAIKHAQELREEREAQLKELFENDSLQKWA
jgi:hypothetical protein